MTLSTLTVATHATMTVRNPTDPWRIWDGLLLVDTGAPDSLVPRFCIEAIGLEPEGQRVYETADDCEIALDFVLARIKFMGDVAAARHHRRRGNRTPARGHGPSPARTSPISRFPIFIERSEDRPMETLIRRNRARPPRGVSGSGLIPVALATPAPSATPDFLGNDHRHRTGVPTGADRQGWKRPWHAAPHPADAAGDESGRSPLPAARVLTHRSPYARRWGP